MTHDKVFFLLKTFFLKFYFLSLCCMSNIFRNCFWKTCRQTAASSRLSNVRRYYIGFALWLVQKIGAPFQPIRWKRKQTTTKSLTFLRALGCLPIHNWVLQAKFNVFLYSLWSISHLPTSHHYDYLTTRVVFFFSFTVCRRRLDLAFLIDGSGSIEAYGRGNFRRCLNFVKRVVASFGISPSQTRVGIVLFSSRARLIANFRSYRNKQSVLHAIGRIRYPRGGTRIGRALRFAKYQLFRKRTSRRKVSVKIIFFLISLTDCSHTNRTFFLPT